MLCPVVHTRSLSHTVSANTKTCFSSSGKDVTLLFPAKTIPRAYKRQGNVHPPFSLDGVSSHVFNIDFHGTETIFCSFWAELREAWEGRSQNT